ncbi:MAG: hypothetical protein DRQ55_18690 [Planctomycetota bacterium]|nr:MAG: hypothetical protein DRQ55_18690 [Planctomycetota bacterium]
MSNQDQAPSLDAEVERLQGILEAERRVTRGRARVLAGISLALLTAVSGVLLSQWSDLTDEWTEDRVQMSFSREMERLGPLAMDELLTLSEHLLPVFAQEGAEQLSDQGGSIRQVVGDELNSVMLELRRDLRRRLQQTQGRIRDGAEAMLLEQYPELADPAQRERLVSTFVAEADGALTGAIEEFVRRYSREVDAFAAALDHYDAAGPDRSTAELQRQLIHLWLLTIDDRIMNS